MQYLKKEIMKALKYIFIAVVLTGMFSACQDDDFNRMNPILAPIDADAVKGQLVGDDYVWSLPSTPAGHSVNVNVLAGNTLQMSEVVDGTTFTHRNVDTNIEYTYVFKLTDGVNQSAGVVKHYMRAGASAISGLSMSQVEKDYGYDAIVEWSPNPTATSLIFHAANGSRIIDETLDAGCTSYTIGDVRDGEVWDVNVTAANEKGKSLPSGISLRVGKTAVAFLSIYPDPETLISTGDDDEASAWLWLHSEYPTAKYVYFGDIDSAEDLEPFRVAFWLRDLEGVGEAEIWNMPEVVTNATHAVSEWYAAGGNLLLWGHATPYIGDLGRLDKGMLMGNDHAFGCGLGGWNGDTWAMAVQLHPGSRFKKDFSSHPIYKGLEVTETDRTKLIKFKGPGWTEDHNCLYFNIPAVLSGIGNQEESCYTASTEQFGIYPLGMWDSQIDWVSQLNVWEARQGDTEFKGTVLCIGNGGCEFSMRNADGTPDISARPTNNIYQENVLTLARNCIEYLKTR